MEGVGSMAAALFAGWLEWRIVHRAIRFAHSEKTETKTAGQHGNPGKNVTP